MMFRERPCFVRFFSTLLYSCVLAAKEKSATVPVFMGSQCEGRASSEITNILKMIEPVSFMILQAVTVVFTVSHLNAKDSD